MTTSRVGAALNPIAKLSMLVCCCTVAFHLKRLGHAVILSGIILLSHGALRIPLDILWRRLRGIVMFALILFLSQLLLVRGMPWHAKAVNGGLMALRFLNIVLSSHLFVSSTSDEDLAYSLMSAGLPYRYGFTLLTALRFIPYFRLQANTVLQAQMARGIAVDRPTPKGIYYIAKYTFVPLVVTALSKVETLAISMEGRCFGLYSERTFLRRIPFRWLDVFAIVTSVLVTIFILAR